MCALIKTHLFEIEEHQDEEYSTIVIKQDGYSNFVSREKIGARRSHFYLAIKQYFEQIETEADYSNGNKTWD